MSAHSAAPRTGIRGQRQIDGDSASLSRAGGGPLSAADLERIAAEQRQINAKAIRLSAQEQVAAPTSAREPPLSPVHPAAVLALRRAADIAIEAISWLWSGWLARGKLHMLGGVPGTGKTTIAMSLAAILTRSGHWPDGTPSFARGNVLIWSGEDDAADTLVPRLTAMNADCSRVHIIGDMHGERGRRAFDPSVDMQALIDAAIALGDVSLLIIDPVVSSVAGDSHKNAEVRRGLAPLVDFAQQLDAAVLGITHFSKGTQGRDPLDRLTGSLAFGAAPRLVFAATKKTEQDGLEQTPGQERLLVRVKSNIGPDGGGIGYELAAAELPQGIVTSTVRWGSGVEGSAREILAQAESMPGDDEEGSAQDEARDFLRRELADGPVGARDLRRHAEDAGIAWATLRRAKDAIGVKAQRSGFGGSGSWRWGLPEPKVLKDTIEAHTKSEGTYGNREHLCGSESDSEVL